MSHPYERLTPDLILDALAATGLSPDGHLLALNSYENRVFQVGIDDGSPMVAKFYRPERWSDASIIEEHRFAAELAGREIPVVAPWQGADGRTLFRHAGFRFAVFPRRGGRAPEPGDLDQLEWTGRFIGRIHLAGSARRFEHRPSLTVAALGRSARDEVLASPLLPAHERDGYAQASAALLDAVEQILAEVDPRPLRLHGDCHHGNILWTDQGPHFVDLDDARMGPAMQDLWMLLSGERAAMSVQLKKVLSGYEQFTEFDRQELNLLEPLRTLRLIHYSAWIARRWDDPAFPAAFPWFNTPRYWQDRILELREQIALMQEAPLEVD